MQIKTRTALIPADAIQSAYNKLVMSDRMALAREIERIWINSLTQQTVVPPEEARHPPALPAAAE